MLKNIDSLKSFIARFDKNLKTSSQIMVVKIFKKINKS